MENKLSFESLKQKVSPETTFRRAENLEYERNNEPPNSELSRGGPEKTTADFYDEKISGALNDKPPLTDLETDKIVLELSPEKHDKQMEELLGILSEKGLKNTLKIIEKIGNPHLSDDFHRLLVQYFSVSPEIDGLEKSSQLFRSVNMKLYEVTMPGKGVSDKEKDFKILVGAMEQFYAGMLSISDSAEDSANGYFTLEVALNNVGNEIIFYAAVPKAKAGLFEKQIAAVFPESKIREAKDDYNIFNDDGFSLGSYGKSLENPIFPLKTYDQFDYDPLNVVINVFSKLKEKGEGAAIQLIVSPAGNSLIKRYGLVLNEVKKGAPIKKAIKKWEESFGGALLHAAKDVFIAPKKDEKEDKTVDDKAVESVNKKLASTLLNVNLRIVSSAGTLRRTEEILSDLKSAFNQFREPNLGNGITWNDLKGRNLLEFLRSFSYREFDKNFAIPLNLKETASILHFPLTSTAAPSLKESGAIYAPAPVNLPQSGTLLGVNRQNDSETKIYLGREDRMRHLYVIGQTGTGKTTLLKNMVIQDIYAGAGVCMIDPHGSDIDDILGLIPKERAEDVIYFDPSYTARPMGLNLLEYDPKYPEQKTFVTDEIYGIFRKLYADVPEAFGPMFEQYYRNATMLVLDDPLSGNTMLEIYRVFADEKFRELKLSRCKNPVVIEFWKSIAEKARGEAALSDIAPYIVGKFDVFLSNEIMRPIIAQEKSAFNLREAMDGGKILLINLSKGRLGERNASLLGLIIVGKVLMAALSRVDIPDESKRKDFYLYIDEFQNVTTNSITQILSEARKYRLGLTIANQFIAQLEEGIKNAVFGNVGSLAAFRVGRDDADYLEKQFAPIFKAEDLLKIENRKACLKLLVNGAPAKPFTLETLPPQVPDKALARALKEASYLKYGRERSEVEKEILEKYQAGRNPEPKNS